MGKIVFAGERRDVPRLMAACDVFVLASLWEGFGLVFAEAMAAGRPVVGTNVSAVPEVVADGETGLLVPPRDPRALAAALLRLLGDPEERRRMGRNGYARVRERFSAGRMVDETLAVYEAVLAGRGGGAGRGAAVSLRALRVLHVMESTIGGTKRHLLELAQGLRASGCEAEVACPRVRGEAFGDVSFWDDLAAAGVPGHEVPMERRPLAPANLRATRTLAALLRRGRFDVVHAHSSIAGAVARPAAVLAGRSRPRVVYTPHGFAFLTPGSAGRRRTFLAVERLLGRATDRLVAVSPTEAEAAVAFGVVPRERVVTIPNGVDLPESPDPERRAFVRRREGWNGVRIVGTVSRMTPQKDPATWLAVAARWPRGTRTCASSGSGAASRRRRCAAGRRPSACRTGSASPATARTPGS